jgi:hypothetical protein
MSRLPFSCSNTVQRLRERVEANMRGKEQLMGNVRVAYTITVKAVDGKELSFDKERTLYEQNAVKPENLQDILERDFRATEQTSLQHQLGKKITNLTFKVTKVTELQSAGDDDQM